MKCSILYKGMDMGIQYPNIRRLNCFNIWGLVLSNFFPNLIKTDPNRLQVDKNFDL